MKCPKCGYNSFEDNNACPKCAADLTGFKGTFGLTPLLFSQTNRIAMAQELMSSLQSEEHGEEAETATDMFAFDLPDDTPATPANIAANDDPFNFDETPPAISGNNEFSFDDQPASAADDPFASLLESTSQAENDPFAGLSAPPQPAPVAPPAPGAAGEFDLNNFSWDDTPAPAPAATTTTAATPIEDDFDSLFGDTDTAAKK